MDVRGREEGRAGTFVVRAPVLGDAAYRSTDGGHERFHHLLLSHQYLQRWHSARNHHGYTPAQTGVVCKPTHRVSSIARTARAPVGRSQRQRNTQTIGNGNPDQRKPAGYSESLVYATRGG